MTPEMLLIALHCPLLVVLAARTLCTLRPAPVPTYLESPGGCRPTTRPR